jgi:arginase
MPLAGLAGFGDPRWVGLNSTAGPTIDPMNIALVGVRDLDPGERDLLKLAGVKVFSILKIDQLGLFQVMQQAIEIASVNTDGIYLSFDMDALNPVYAPGVGTAVQGGLTYREAHMACEMIAETGKLAGMDLVEVNTILDERNKTAALAMELACSALGQRVW